MAALCSFLVSLLLFRGHAFPTPVPKSGGVIRIHTQVFSTTTPPNFRTVPDTEGDSDDWWQEEDRLSQVEIVTGEDEDDDEEDWTPDAEFARRSKMRDAAAFPKVDEATPPPPPPPKPSPYTEEEQELIDAMGGKKRRNNMREPGFLGDSTLTEITRDFGVPICYIADVLCMWGVPVPIEPSSRLGDLVTGEQAFALVEAVHSLDMGVLQDRYSDSSLVQVCFEWDIDVGKAFEMCMNEGWSMPFGVQTHLRVEQEDDLIRHFST